MAATDMKATKQRKADKKASDVPIVKCRFEVVFTNRVLQQVPAGVLFTFQTNPRPTTPCSCGPNGSPFRC